MPINARGTIVLGTIENLVEGLRSTPLTREAVDAVMSQASTLTEKLVDTYSTQIADGEVGSGATGRATELPIIADRPPRALLYGRIQSGKTVAMILTAAIALDNGFRVVVVLTTDNKALVRQTANRFKNLDGPRVFSGVKDGSDTYEWEGQEDQLRTAIATDGLVLVCTKNSVNLPEVIRFLAQIDAASYPVLIMDDEADAATPDTTAAARSAAKTNAPAFASTIHRLVIENTNPLEPGLSLGALPHNLYVQVTATPYVLLLQKNDAQLRPTVTYLLEPGQGYCGGEVFFGQYSVDSLTDPYPGKIVVVDDNEAAVMMRRAPAGFAKSLDFFILSACARANEVGWPSSGKGFKHLSHTSHRIGDHELVANYISSHLNEIRTSVRESEGGLEAYFTEAYSELQRSLNPCPPLRELVVTASAALRQTEVLRINSKEDVLDYGPRLNFIVGGNILGRGLTIDDLLVTYYIREAKTSQMDTVWQHARMFGYRKDYLDYIRIYLPHALGIRFKQLHETDDLLREVLADGDSDEAIVIALPADSRPTRPNALEVGVMRTIPKGRGQINPHFLKLDADAASVILELLKQSDVPIELDDRGARAIRLPFDKVVELIRNVAVRDEDPGYWQEDIAVAILSSYQDVKERGCCVYVRRLTSGQSEERTRGRLSGPEIALIREAAGPVPALALLYSGEPHSPEGWYPTLVMPIGAQALVFTT